MRRDSVLKDVRAALGGGRVEPPAPPAWEWPQEAIGDLVVRFAQELVAVQGEWVAWDQLPGLLSTLGAKRCMVGPGVDLDALGLGLEAAESAETLGVVRAEHAVAETGSVVFDADGSHRPQLYPDVVIVLLDPATLVGRLEELPPPVDQDRHRVVVTGPSRTADIEKRLVLGAHGPTRLIIVPAQ